MEMDFSGQPTLYRRALDRFDPGHDLRQVGEGGVGTRDHLGVTAA